MLHPISTFRCNIESSMFNINILLGIKLLTVKLRVAGLEINQTPKLMVVNIPSYSNCSL
ncbi:hypothetical protein ISN45_At05g048770 [Arabidopsis thaliana x Arabidopsis arenosa]|uniref:Uncharacterized protein n=1 Tax=Arabidopsis thaliana x Arabidopsis arenosa TaxID=1240361 RepID=A0A8T2D9Y9_9BRAS|nr:hypothetical protein ISN45_At05g048770 [Arabidopsis thaliana x Arabidopsis arenosa]